jgi:hypothetical protein
VERDFFSDLQGGGGSGGGGVEYVDHAGGFGPEEVVDELAGGAEGLSADAGGGGGEVVGADFGDEFLEGFDEGRFAERAVNFTESHAPVR